MVDHVRGIAGCLAVALLVGSLLPGRAPAVETAALEEALAGVAGYESGDSRAALNLLEDLVMEASGNREVAGRVAARIAELLEDDEATEEARAFICRQLWVIGTPGQVEALEPLLEDERLSHMARYALQGIAGEEVDAALRRAMGRVSGRLLVGVINSIGERGDAEAVDGLIQRLGHADAEVAEAAAVALGKIGGEQAVEAIASTREETSGRLRSALTDAYLRSAGRLLEAGENGRAESIYEELRGEEEPAHVRLGALNGLVAARGGDAIALLVEAATGEQEPMSVAAVRHLEAMEEAEATEALLGLLDEVEPPQQAVVLDAIGARGDRAAEAKVAGMARDAVEGRVRRAAVEALAGVGGPDSVGRLATIAAVEEAELREAGRQSLARLRGERINPTIFAELERAEEPVRLELIEALSARRATETADPLLLFARTAASANERRAAFAALSDLGGPEQFDALVTLLVAERDDAARAAARGAVASVARQVEDPERRLRPLVRAHRASRGDARVAVIGVLGSLGGSDALAPVHADVEHPDGAVRDAAIRALADWPDPSALGVLRELAQDVDDRTHRILSLRGHIRLIGQTERSASWKVERYREALELAERAQEKQMILAGLAELAHPDALALAQSLQEDPQVATEAEQTADRIRRALEDGN